MINIKRSDYLALMRVSLPMFIEWVFTEVNPSTPYLDNFHIPLIAGYLEKMRLDDLRRLIINIPPRNLKSIIVSVAYVAWLMGHDPTCKIICVSYAQDLADFLARMCRLVMMSPRYHEMFPQTRISPFRTAASGFETTLGGYRFATSLDGPLLGFGADYIIIDDIVNAQEVPSDPVRNRVAQWYRALVTRLNDKRTGRIIIIMQRLHVDDLVGHVLELEPWKVIALPAIATQREIHVIETPFGTYTHIREEGEALHPDREPLEILSEIHRAQGEEAFWAQYQQAPVAPGGNLIKVDQFQGFDLNDPPPFDRIVQSWDTAGKATELGSYSVCTTWGTYRRAFYLLNIFRARLAYPDLRTRARGMALSGTPYGRPEAVLIEAKSSGEALLQDLRRDGVYSVVGIQPESDKVTRMSAQTTLIANGAVFIPKEAPWRDEFIQELIAFPRGRYNDQVDSVSQALKWIGAEDVEPAMTTFYRMQVEARRGPMDGDDIVLMECMKKSVNVVYLVNGDQLRIGSDGYFRVPKRYSRGMLADWRAQWRLVEDS